MPKLQDFYNQDENLVNSRMEFIRFDLKSFHSLKNRNMVSITAMGFGIGHNLFKEGDL